MQSSILHMSRSSPPAPREMYFSFGHLHKNLVPVVEESDDSEDERPRKKEAWRKRLHIPDYRKVKIGEYYDEDLDISCSGEGESDMSARSSFESENSVEGKTATPIPQVRCAGCNFNFSPASTPISTPTIEQGTSSCNFGKHQHGSRSKKLRLKTSTHTKYRCLWPGCKIILCGTCTNLMEKPKTSGGMGGSLSALKTYLEQQRNHIILNTTNTSESAPNTERADGAITADIVQAATSTPTSPTTVKRPANGISETINLVNHAVAAVEGKIVGKAVAEIIAQKELSQKLDAVGHRDSGEPSQSGVHAGIVVTVKELGLVGKPKAL